MKVLVWLYSGEKEKLWPGLMFAKRATENRWLEDVKVVVFGEAEKLYLEDNEMREFLKDIPGVLFCKRYAENTGIYDALKSLGVDIIYVGEYIAGLIKEGYQVLTF